jgi:hypothetical protein
MKILKQQLQELYAKGWYSPIPTKEEAVRLGVEHTLNCVKEWLEQKRQQVDTKEKLGDFTYKKTIAKQIYAELLEELKP